MYFSTEEAALHTGTGRRRRDRQPQPQQQVPGEEEPAAISYTACKPHSAAPTACHCPGEMSAPGDDPELDFDYLFEYEYDKSAGSEDRGGWTERPKYCVPAGV